MSPEKPDLEFYSIFCGVFLYKSKKTNGAFVPWTDRINSTQEFHEYIGRTYYQNYFNNIFKGSAMENSQRENSFLEHATLGAILPKPLFCDVPQKVDITISISYFDTFLFSDGIGIFCFKVQPADGQQVTYSRVSELLGSLRNPLSQIVTGAKRITVTRLIQDQLEVGYALPANWNQYLNQLKSYAIINDPSLKGFTAEEDKLLFELSHAMPVGTINLGMPDKPTATYYEGILRKKSIFIYDNWKAVSLLDSFTRISCNFPDPYRSWELDYFHIYVHCLYSKFQLYYFNSQLTDLLLSSNKTASIRDKFVEFVNDYSLPYISYKFLPNLLYEKMTASLEIQKERDSMETKINRLNEAYQNRRSKQLNTLLVVISILSLTSVINDISQWLGQLGIASNWMYIPLTILLALGTITTIAWLIFRKK